MNSGSSHKGGIVVEKQLKTNLAPVKHGKYYFGAVLVKKPFFNKLRGVDHFVLHFFIFGNAHYKIKNKFRVFPLCKTEGKFIRHFKISCKFIYIHIIA